jgi:beta-glucosidase-like glycosyl hydrolase
MDLTPDLDVNNNPANPVISTRSFGSDPHRVAEFGVAYIQAMQKRRADRHRQTFFRVTVIPAPIRTLRSPLFRTTARA